MEVNGVEVLVDIQPAHISLVSPWANDGRKARIQQALIDRLYATARKVNVVLTEVRLEIDTAKEEPRLRVHGEGYQFPDEQSYKDYGEPLRKLVITNEGVPENSFYPVLNKVAH